MRRSLEIMVIEDNADVRQSLVDLLHQCEFSVVAAGNGIQALRALEDGAAPDVIVLDLELPFLSGWQLYRELRKTPRFADIPVVIVTAHDVGQSALPGAAAVLQKPLFPASLVSVLRAAAGVHVPGDRSA